MELIRIQDEKGVTSAPKKKFAKKNINLMQDFHIFQFLDKRL